MESLQQKADTSTCGDMIVYQLVVFVLFYLSLIVIIAAMYLKYRRECRHMEQNEGSDKANFFMVKRLMDQYDQKQRFSSTVRQERLLSHRGPPPNSATHRNSEARVTNTSNRFSALLIKDRREQEDETEFL